MPIKAVLFDFDGTLVETRTASWELFRETDREFDLGLDTQASFFRIFEGNFYASLAQHCGDEAIASAAGKHFMELVRTRYNPSFIPGIAAVVRRMARDLSLAIVSSNMHETIHRILDREGLLACFPEVFAGDVEPCKATAIKDFLRGPVLPGTGSGRDAPDRYSPDEVFLVTDTVGDVAEAVGSGIGAYGVEWGMHTREQLLAAGAERVAGHPQQLLHWFNQLSGVSAAEMEDCRA